MLKYSKMAWMTKAADDERIKQDKLKTRTNMIFLPSQTKNKNTISCHAKLSSQYCKMAEHKRIQN